jgi:hypothetical protein
MKASLNPSQLDERKLESGEKYHLLIPLQASAATLQHILAGL